MFNVPFECRRAPGNLGSCCSEFEFAVRNTGYTQKNGAVSKVNKTFISHFTRAQSTPSAAATVQVSHAYCGAAGPVSKMASQQEKAFCVLRFEFRALQ